MNLNRTSSLEPLVTFELTVNSVRELEALLGLFNSSPSEIRDLVNRGLKPLGIELFDKLSTTDNDSLPDNVKIFNAISYTYDKITRKNK